MSGFGFKNLLGVGKGKPGDKSDSKVVGTVKSANTPSTSTAPTPIALAKPEGLEAHAAAISAAVTTADAAKSAPTVRKHLFRALLDFVAVAKLSHKSQLTSAHRPLENALKTAIYAAIGNVYSPMLLRMMADAVNNLFGCGDIRSLPSFVLEIIAKLSHKDTSIHTRIVILHILGDLFAKFDRSLWFASDPIPVLLKHALDHQDPMVRAAATTSLVKAIEAARDAGQKHHAAVLKHIQSVSLLDAQYTVRIAASAALTALANSSGAFSSIGFDVLVSTACRILCDPHHSVRISAAIALASILATSVAAKHHTADSGALEERLRGERMDGDAGAGGFDNEDNDDGDVSAAKSGKGKGKPGGGNPAHKLSFPSLPFKTRRKSSVDATSTHKAAGQLVDITACMGFLAELIKHAGRFAFTGGIRIGDIRVAVAVCGACLLRTVRSTTVDALPDDRVADVLQALLQCLHTDTGPQPSVYMAAAAQQLPASGEHTHHALRVVAHIIEFGLLTPPAQAGAVVSDRWRRWQQHVLSCLHNELTKVLEGNVNSDSTTADTPTSATLPSPTATTPSHARGKEGFRPKLSLRRKKSKIASKTGGVGFSRATTSAPNCQHHVATLCCNVLTTWIPTVVERGTAESQVMVQEMLPTAIKTLEQQSAELRDAGSALIRALTAIAPSHLTPTLYNLMENARLTLSEITSPQFLAGVFAAAASSAMADSQQLSQVTKASGSAANPFGAMKKLLGAGGSKPNAGVADAAAGNSGGVNVMTHVGVSPAFASHGGFGAPGSGPGSGTGVCVGEHAAYLAQFIGVCRAISDCFTQISSELTLLSEAQTKAFQPVIHAVVHLACDIAAAGQAMAAPDAVAGTSRLHGGKPSESDQKGATIAQAARLAAAAEVQTAVTFGAFAILSAVSAPMCDSIKQTDVWDRLFFTLASEIISFREWQVTHGMGSPHDGTGVFALVHSQLSPEVIRASDLLSKSSVTTIAPQKGKADSDTLIASSGAEDAHTPAVLRGLYTGLTTAWWWYRFSAATKSLSSIANTVANHVKHAPKLLRQVYQLCRISAACLVDIPVLPLALESGALPSSQSIKIFEAAAAHLSTPFTSLIARDTPTAAVDEAYQVSVHGVSLAAIASSRASYVNALLSVLRTCRTLPLNTLTCMPLRGPILQMALAVMSSGTVSLDLLSMGLLAEERSSGEEISFTELQTKLSRLMSAPRYTAWNPLCYIIGSRASPANTSLQRVLSKEDAELMAGLSCNLSSGTVLHAPLHVHLPPSLRACVTATAEDFHVLGAAADVSIELIAEVLPFLPLGQADGIATAMSAPFKPNAVMSALASNPMAGFQLSSRIQEGIVKLASCRNFAAAIVCCLRNTSQEHVCGQAEDSEDRNPVPVAWILTIRAALAAAVCNEDAVVRLLGGRGLAELTRICGVAFGQKLVSALLKQITSHSSPPAERNSHSTPSHVICGALVSAALVKRALQDAHNVQASEDTLLFEFARDTKYATRWAAVYAWYVQLQAAIAEHKRTGDATLLSKYLQPTWSVLEAQTLAFTSPYDARTQALTRLAADPLCVKTTVEGQVASRAATTVAWNDKGPGVSVLSWDKDMSKPVSVAADAWFADSVMEMCGPTVYSSGAVVTTLNAAGTPSVASYASSIKDSGSRETGVVLPLCDPLSGDIVPPSGALTALIDATVSDVKTMHTPFPNITALLPSSSSSSSAHAADPTGVRQALASYRATIRAASALGVSVTSDCISSMVVNRLENTTCSAVVDADILLADDVDAFEKPMSRLLSRVFLIACQALRALAPTLTPDSARNSVDKALSMWALLCGLNDAVCASFACEAAQILQEISKGLGDDTNTTVASAVNAALTKAWVHGGGPVSASFSPQLSVNDACLAFEDCFTHAPPHLILHDATTETNVTANCYWHLGAERLGIVWAAPVNNKSLQTFGFRLGCSTPALATWISGCMASGLVPCTVTRMPGEVDMLAAGGISSGAAGTSVSAALDFRSSRWGHNQKHTPSQLALHNAASSGSCCSGLQLFHAARSWSAPDASIWVRWLTLSLNGTITTIHRFHVGPESAFAVSKSEIAAIGPLSDVLFVYAAASERLNQLKCVGGAAAAQPTLLKLLAEMERFVREQSVPSDVIFDCLLGTVSPSTYWQREFERVQKAHRMRLKAEAVKAAKMQGDFGPARDEIEPQDDVELGMFSLEALGLVDHADDGVKYVDPVSATAAKCSTITELLASADVGAWRRDRSVLGLLAAGVDRAISSPEALKKVISAAIVLAGNIVEDFNTADVEGGVESQHASEESNNTRGSLEFYVSGASRVPLRVLNRVVSVLAKVQDPDLPQQHSSVSGQNTHSSVLWQHQAVLLSAVQAALSNDSPIGLCDDASDLAMLLLQGGVFADWSSLRALLRLFTDKLQVIAYPTESCARLFVAADAVVDLVLASCRKAEKSNIRLLGYTASAATHLQIDDVKAMDYVFSFFQSWRAALASKRSGDVVVGKDSAAFMRLLARSELVQKVSRMTAAAVSEMNGTTTAAATDGVVGRDSGCVQWLENKASDIENIVVQHPLLAIGLPIGFETAPTRASFVCERLLSMACRADKANRRVFVGHCIVGSGLLLTTSKSALSVLLRVTRALFSAVCSTLLTLVDPERFVAGLSVAPSLEEPDILEAHIYADLANLDSLLDYLHAAMDGLTLLLKQHAQDSVVVENIYILRVLQLVLHSVLQEAVANAPRKHHKLLEAALHACNAADGRIMHASDDADGKLSHPEDDAAEIIQAALLQALSATDELTTTPSPHSNAAVVVLSRYLQELRGVLPTSICSRVVVDIILSRNGDTQAQLFAALLAPIHPNAAHDDRNSVLEWHFTCLQKVIRDVRLPVLQRVAVATNVVALLGKLTWLEELSDKTLYISETRHKQLNTLAAVCLEALLAWVTEMEASTASTMLKPVLHLAKHMFQDSNVAVISSISNIAGSPISGGEDAYDYRWLDTKGRKLAGQMALSLAQKCAAAFRSLLQDADVSFRQAIEGGMRAALSGQAPTSFSVVFKHGRTTAASSTTANNSTTTTTTSSSSSIGATLKKPTILFDTSKFKAAAPAPKPADVTPAPSLLAAYLAGMNNDEEEENTLGMRAHADDDDEDDDDGRGGDFDDNLNDDDDDGAQNNTD